MPLDSTPNETEQLRARAYAAEERLAAIERSATESLKNSAFDEALKPFGLDPTAAAQVKALLANDVRLQPDEAGRLTAVGPSLKPLGSFISETLAKPEWSRFRTGSSPVSSPFMPSGGAPRTLGEHLIAQAHQARAAAGDARVDMGQRFGLGRGPTTPIAQQRDDGRIER